LIDHLKNSNIALENFKKGLDKAFGSYKDQIKLGEQLYFDCFQTWMTLPDKVVELRQELSNLSSSSSSSVDPSLSGNYCDAVALLVSLVHGHIYVSNTPEIMKSEKRSGIHSYVQSRIDRLKDSILQVGLKISCHIRVFHVNLY
jgi:hypothetical protein